MQIWERSVHYFHWYDLHMHVKCICIRISSAFRNIPIPNAMTLLPSRGMSLRYSTRTLTRNRDTGWATGSKACPWTKTYRHAQFSAITGRCQSGHFPSWKWSQQFLHPGISSLLLKYHPEHGILKGHLPQWPVRKASRISAMRWCSVYGMISVRSECLFPSAPTACPLWYR